MTTLINIVILYIFSLLLVYPISKYTTIGNHLWFGDFIYQLADKFNKQSIKDKIVSISYSKLLTCRPCHSFWMTLGVSSCMVNFPLALFHSFLTYFLIRIYHDKKQR